MRQLGSYLTFGKLFCGVEHTFINGKNTINSLLLQKKGNEFLVKKSIECERVKMLSKQLPKAQHLFLIINDDNLLFKSLDGVFEMQKAIALAFPNLTIDDFYCEILHGEHQTFVAICRKDVVDSLVEKYRKHGLHVIGFSLGNLRVVSLISFLKDDTSLETSNGLISFSNQKISSIKDSTSKSDKTVPIFYVINGLKISQDRVLALGGIIAYYTKDRGTFSNFSTINEGLDAHFKSHRVFEVGLKAGLGTVFVLLLASFLLFSSYTAKVERLSSVIALNKTHKDSLRKLALQVQQKEQLLARFSSVSSKASWFLSKIGGTVPNSVLLSSIVYQPLVNTTVFDTREKENTEMMVDENKVVVKGKSTRGNGFSEWVGLLERTAWIEKVTILQYGKGKKAVTEFELLIFLKK